MLSHAAQTDAAMSGQLDYARVDADFYPTPPQYVDCLHHLEPLKQSSWWEPACGEGHMSKRVQQLTGNAVYSTDLHDRGYGLSGMDFLDAKAAPDFCTGIITNPPYETIERAPYGKMSLAEMFIRKSLELMEPVNGKVAMFLRNEFDCGKERRGLFANHPFAHKIVVTQRPRWIEGSKGSPRHSYSWYIWNFACPGDARISYVHPVDVPTIR